MGNDGGDIPKRKQLVKEKQKQERPNMESIAMGRSRFCNLTNQRLKQPLAIDRLGCIFNYDNIVEAMVKKTLASKYAYIKKISDIKKVSIERAPADSNNFICCPITKLQYNGFNKFVGLWPCGHILSRKAFKQIQNNEKKCLVCETPYEEKDIIDLNVEGEQLQINRKKLIEKKKTKESKKSSSTNQDNLGNPQKKVKIDPYISSVDRLGGQFRDVLRQRSKFKQIFTKEKEQQWKKNTYTVNNIQ